MLEATLKWGETSSAVFRHHVPLHTIRSTKGFFADRTEPTHVNSSRAKCRLTKRQNVAHLYSFSGHKIYCFPPPPPPPLHFYCFPSTTATTFQLFSSTTIITTFLLFSCSIRCNAVLVHCLLSNINMKGFSKVTIKWHEHFDLEFLLLLRNSFMLITISLVLQFLRNLPYNNFLTALLPYCVCIEVFFMFLLAGVFDSLRCRGLFFFFQFPVSQH